MRRARMHSSWWQTRRCGKPASKAARSRSRPAGAVFADPTWLDPSGAVLVIPDLGAAECRALVEQRSIRYLVSAAGLRAAKPTIEPHDVTLEFTHSHAFDLFARAFDTRSGSSVCEGGALERGSSMVGVGFLPYFIPIPLFRALDESGYWMRVGWYTGEKIGGCFVQPGEKK